MQTRYIVKANRTAADVVANNEVLIGSGLQIDEAHRVAIAAQKFSGFIAAWVEETPERKETRTVECDRTGQKYVVVRYDGWAI